MIAPAMLYTMATGLLIVAGAAAVEWTLQHRLPARHIWSAAMLALLVVPAAMLARAGRTEAGNVRPQAAASAVPLVGNGEGAAPGRAGAQLGHHAAGARARGGDYLAMRAALSTGIARLASTVLDATAVALWLLGSGTALLWLASVLWYWRRVVGALPQMEVEGVSVVISERMGPAAIGLLRTTIMLPRWALDLSEADRQLILAHELGHSAAHDPQRVFGAALIVALMP